MRLVEWRREQALSQADLAERVGCDQSLISRIERAVDPRVPCAEIMIRIYIVTRGAVTLEDLAFPNGVPDFETGELAFDAPAPLLDEHREAAIPEAQLQDIAA